MVCETLSRLTGLDVRFSALLVGLFIDGLRPYASSTHHAIVSVPFWLGCSLMAEAVMDMLVSYFVSVPFWLGCSLMDGTIRGSNGSDFTFQCPFGWAVH